MDTSKAPPDHPDLAGLIHDIQDRLSEGNFVKAISIHEAAHAVYWERIGRDTAPDYAIRITSDDDGHCLVEYAAVVLLNYAEEKETPLLGLAEAHAAGSAATEVLAPGYDPGDVADLKGLRRDIPATLLVAHNLTVEEIWEAAKEAVKSKVQSDSAVRAEIGRRAGEFERGFRAISEVTDC